MLEYMIVLSTKSKDLQEQVNKYIKKDWVPLGGVTVTEDKIVRHWAQAMTKEIP